MKIKNLYSLALISTFLFAITSCNTEKESGKLEVISVENAYNNQAAINASDCFSKIRYVKLETTDESLVGNKPLVWISGNRLIVTSNQKQCLVFDKETGKFICSIGHIGNGPEGSQSLSGWLNVASSRIYFPKGNGNNVVYDTDGNFIGTQKDPELTDGFYGIDNYDYLNSEILVKHLPATDKMPDRIVLYRDTTILALFPSHGESVSRLSGSVDNIQEISVMKNKERDIINIKYKDGMQNSLVPSEQIFWHLGDNLFFRELFNDTIYKVEQQGLLPVKRFDFGSMSWAREDRYNPEKDNAIYPLDVYENDRVLWLRFIVNFFHPDKWEMYNAVYDKKDGTVKVSPFDDGINDDLNGFISLQPSFSSHTGEFAQIVSVEDIQNWFDENSDKEDLPESVEMLRNISDEDNPVVVLME